MLLVHEDSKLWCTRYKINHPEQCMKCLSTNIDVMPYATKGTRGISIICLVCNNHSHASVSKRTKSKWWLKLL